MGRRGGLIRVVAADHTASASVSPDGKLVAWQGDGGIRVENVDGSDSRLLVSAPIGVGMPFVWSPDSGKLLIRDADKGLAVVALSTGTVRQVIPPKARVVYIPIAWSRPARKILFSTVGRTSGHPRALVVARPSGASQRTIYRSMISEDLEPEASWSPDGKWISFTTTAGRGPRLAIVNASTNAMKRVRSVDPVLRPPVWAPDSSRFAIGGRGTIGLFSPAGKRLGSLKPPFTYADVRAWTGGGIYVKSFQVNIMGRRLLVFAHGRQKPRTVFTLPRGQALLEIQPF